MASPFAFWGMGKSLDRVSNEELVSNLKLLKAREDEVLVEVLEHIQEFERRKLHLKLGHPTLYGYLTEVLGYSESEAYRRIESSRFVKSNPELKALIKKGRLTLTSISEVRSAVRSIEKINQKPISRQEQIELAKAVVDSSKKETQKILAQKLPEFKPVEYERKQELVDGGIQITMRLTKPQREKVDTTKDILVRGGPVGNTATLLEKLCDFFMRKKDLTQPKSTQSLNSRKETARKAPESTQQIRPHISMNLRRAVFRRDNGRCQFKAPDGKTCNTTYNIAIDHIIPLSAGGPNTLENLRCLCRAHNQWKADKIIN